MVEYNKVNIKLLDLQLIKLKTEVKNRQGLTLISKCLMEIIYPMNYY